MGMVIQHLLVLPNIGESWDQHAERMLGFVASAGWQRAKLRGAEAAKQQRWSLAAFYTQRSVGGRALN